MAAVDKVPFIQVHEVLNDMFFAHKLSPDEEIDMDAFAAEFTDRDDWCIVMWAPQAEEYEQYSDLYRRFWEFVYDSYEVEPKDYVCVFFEP